MSRPNPQTHPRVWVIWGDKAGDNAQISTIIEQLPVPAEFKKVRFKANYDKKKPFFHASIRHIDLSQSDALSSPWPDLIITAGRRPAMAALWVKDMNQGNTKIVLLGRPKRWLHRYDLIIASAQYQLPDWPNIIHLDLPLLKIKPDRLRRAHRESLQSLGNLPQPITALMVGGVTRPYVFDAKGARELLKRAAAQTPASGTLYVVTSRRTPASVYHALQESLPSNARLYDWQSTTRNPYLGLLSRADTIIVTGDSISMITEAVRAQARTLIYELPHRLNVGGRLVDGLLGGLNWDKPKEWQLLCERMGVASFPRDLQRFHRRLYALGAAAPLTDKSPATHDVKADVDATHARQAFDLAADVERVVNRIEALLGEHMQRHQPVWTSA